MNLVIGNCVKKYMSSSRLVSSVNIIHISFSNILESNTNSERFDMISLDIDRDLTLNLIDISETADSIYN